ncbi:MAG: PQQ-like beta-propeller repeat protein [Actinomycetota bacterium]|nr:PQQ-like beta-propeller repeat protein [Actinomycetota bacterium]
MSSTPLLRRTRRPRRALILALAVGLAVAGQAEAQVGFEAGVSKFHHPTWGTNKLDPTPYSARIWDIAVKGDTAYIGGEFTALAPTLELAGAIDGASGLPQPGFPKLESGEVKVAVPDGAGGWYIGGNFKISLGPTDTRVALARIRADGTVDPQWKPELAAQQQSPSTVYALAVHSSYVYVGGDFTKFQGGDNVRTHLARLSASTGTVDRWNATLDGSVVRSLAVSPDGSMVYVAGDFQNVNAVPRNGLAALRSAGAALEAWAPALSNVGSMAVAPDNSKVYLGGDSLAATDPAGNVLWNHAGKVKSLAVGRSGATVYAGGEFSSLGGQPRGRLAAVDTTSGAVDPSWMPSANDAVTAVTISEDGSKVYVGGNFTDLRGHPRNRLAAVDAATGTVEAWDPNARDGAIVALSVSGSQVYAGGTFKGLGAVPRHMLGAINIRSGEGEALSWAPVIKNLDSGGSPIAGEPPIVQALALSEDGTKVYVGGNFSHVTGPGGTDLPRDNLVALDAQTGLADPNFKPGALQGTVRSLAVNGNTLYVGGDFKEVRVSGTEQGQNRPDNPCPPAHLNQDCFPQGTKGTSSRWVRHGLIAAFNGSTGVLDTNFNRTPESTGCGLIGQAGNDCGIGNGAVKAIVIDPIRGYLYAGGTFSDLGGQLGMYSTNLSDGSFTSWQPDIDFPAFDLDLFKGDNFQTLFVAAGGAGGHLMAYRPHTSNDKALWDRRFDGDSMAVDSSPTTVYSGGHYDFVDGGTYRRKHAAAFSVDGAIAVNWDPEIDTNTGVFTVEVVPGKTVIYGGEFSRVNRRPQPGYAQFMPLPGRQP